MDFKNQMKKYLLPFILFLLIIAGNAQSATATYSFIQVTSNGDTDVSSQLTMKVDDYADSGALFTFYNDVGISSSISQVYFDDSSVDNLFSSIDFHSQSTGVKFDVDGSGGNFGTDYDFDTTFTSKKEAQKTNGVDESIEWVSFFGTYDENMDFSALLAAILDSSFNTGLHVISIAQSDGTDKSEKFVIGSNGIPVTTTGIPAVPLPAALWLFGPALLGFIGFRRISKS